MQIITGPLNAYHNGAFTVLIYETCKDYTVKGTTQ